MVANEKRRLHRAPSALRFAEHDIGANREPLLYSVRVRELACEEVAVELIGKVEVGVVGLVPQHVRSEDVDGHERGGLDRRYHDGLGRIRIVHVRVGGRAVYVVILAETRSRAEAKVPYAVVRRLPGCPARRVLGASSHRRRRDD